MSNTNKADIRKIKWNQDIELEVVENVNVSISGEGEEIHVKSRIFKKDDINEVEIIFDNPMSKTFTVVFNDDQSCLFGLSNEWFEFI